MPPKHVNRDIRPLCEVRFKLLLNVIILNVANRAVWPLILRARKVSGNLGYG
jgi:hypothetical protein